MLSDASIALQRIAAGKPEQSIILVGLRGVGKTVLLVRINELAEQLGFQCLEIEATEAKTLPALLVPGLRKMLFSLSKTENAKELARRGLSVLKSFLNAVRVSVGEVEVGLSIEAEIGTGDSGDLEADLTDLFVVVAEAARAAGKPIALLIDELQYLSEPEFRALIMAIHKINQGGLPLVMIGAGLPQILSLAGNAKSYAERLFKFPYIGALEQEDAKKAIIAPAASQGVKFDEDALGEILATTQSYPYFLQQWGYEAWNIANGPNIHLRDVQEATRSAIAELDQSFFRVRFDRCTPSEKKYMRALADLGSGTHRSGDVADRLGVKSTSVAPVRNSLIKKGMIYSPSHGDTAFTVPMFEKYMLRALPELE